MKQYNFKHDIGDKVWVLVSNSVYEVQVFGHYVTAENSCLDKLYYKIHNGSNISPMKKREQDVFGSKEDLIASL